MNDINQKKDALIKTMSLFSSNEEKYSYIIEQAKKLPSLDDEQKKDNFLIEGCVSNAWIIPKYEDGKVYFSADSEALIVKGIIAILLDIYNGQTPDAILSLDAGFLVDAGILEQLSMNRRNGLSNMIKQIKLYSVAFKSMYADKN